MLLFLVKLYERGGIVVRKNYFRSFIKSSRGMWHGGGGNRHPRESGVKIILGQKDTRLATCHYVTRLPWMGRHRRHQPPETQVLQRNMGDMGDTYRDI